MAIGIQNNNRLPLPGKKENLKTPGRSLSESSPGGSSEPEPVEIAVSSPAAGQSPIVQLNFSGAGARYQALLSGTQATPAAPGANPATPLPNVQADGVPAAAEGPSAGASWIPQTMVDRAALMGLGTSLSPRLLDQTFIHATRDFASALLAAPAPRPARVVPLSTPDSSDPDPK